MTAQTDHIEAALYGNGKEGLLARTARIEEALKNVSESASAASKGAENTAQAALEKFDEVSKSLNALHIDVVNMANSVKVHVDTPHLDGLSKQPKFWAFIVVFFVVLHTIASYVPNIWNLVMMLFGIPQLKIPLV